MPIVDVYTTSSTSGRAAVYSYWIKVQIEDNYQSFVYATVDYPNLELLDKYHEGDSIKVYKYKNKYSLDKSSFLYIDIKTIICSFILAILIILLIILIILCLGKTNFKKIFK